MPALTNEKEPTLADKLGGVPALKAAVEEFCKRLLEVLELGHFFENYNMTALEMHQLQIHADSRGHGRGSTYSRKARQAL